MQHVLDVVLLEERVERIVARDVDDFAVEAVRAVLLDVGEFAPHAKLGRHHVEAVL